MRLYLGAAVGRDWVERLAGIEPVVLCLEGTGSAIELQTRSGVAAERLGRGRPQFRLTGIGPYPEVPPLQLG